MTENTKEKSRIRAVIFDMDGVLVDTEPVSWKVYQKILEPYHQDMTLKQYTENYCGRSEAENVITLVGEYGLPFDPKEFVAETLRLEALELDKGIPLKKGVRETLSWLHENGYECALATSSETVRASKLLGMHDLQGEFCVITNSSGFVHGKPDPEVFLNTCSRLGLNPEECLVIEDSESGVLAASRAGIPVILIPDLKHPSENILKLTAGRLNDLSELPLWLRNQSRKK